MNGKNFESLYYVILSVLCNISMAEIGVSSDKTKAVLLSM
jgi:hypothetical protein